MAHDKEGNPVLPPHVVGTGFTTALLGDERTLREFVVGDHVASTLRETGVNAVLYLVNDTYDPLDERQLRVGVDKDPHRMRQFAPFCGRPIAEIPDPFACHASYAEHFLHGLIDRLYRLDIHPLVLDAHQAYRKGHLAPYVETTLSRYQEIRERLASECHGYTVRNLFRVQCSQCQCIDATEILAVDGDVVSYRCGRCDRDASQERAALRGKLSWKLDCAARWNLYHIDTEVFSKAHLGEKSTLDVARVMARHFFGGHVPEIVRYGDVRLSRSLSLRLLQMLPAQMLKKLLAEHRTRDLELGPAQVQRFAETYEVRPGTSYVDFVRRALPWKALLEAPTRGETPAYDRSLTDRTLVAHANHFSDFYYRRRHEIRLPDPSVFAGAESSTLELARDTVGFALELRTGGASDPAERKAALKRYLAAHESSPAVYAFLRRALGQKDGPNLTTLLAILPREHLATIQLMLSQLANRRGGGASRNDGTDVARAA